VQKFWSAGTITPANSVSPPTRNTNRTAILIALFCVAAAGGAAVLYSLTQWNVPAVAKNLRNPIPPSESAVDNGMFTYSKRCKSCHGENGDGKGDRAGELSVKPTDFTNAAEMNHITDGELYWKITHGHRPMPAFEDKLSDVERWQVVDYIRTFAHRQPASAPK
jgi:mono/diheme cytochrome c family protein